ncbi:MAG: hypothetical protein LBT59_13110 [Clostridiales bacterium]|jgi:hypothetical protein|nr:hypothetical protein [Clostridiales bacterium]
MLRKIIVMFGAVIAILVMIMSVLIVQLYRGGKTYVDTIGIGDISLTQNEFNVKGSISSSAIAYRDYEYKIDGKTLRMSIYGGLVLPVGDMSGSFDIHLKDDRLSEVEFVTLEDGKDTRQILP